MNAKAPFTLDDLGELQERLLVHADAVVAMQEVHAGNHDPRVIGMRHDCDGAHSLYTAMHMAEWEGQNGYRSTYYILHTSPYWGAPGFEAMLERIAIAGHEIGIHADALAASFVQHRDPDLILDEALATLRRFGFQVRGVAGHGNPLCNRDAAPGEGSFANDEQFVECARPQEGEPDRVIVRGNTSLKLNPRPLADFGLDYEALIAGLPIPWRCSDSGGRWVHADYEPKFEDLAYEFECGHVRDRQLHLLVHPDWWNEALDWRGKYASYAEAIA